MTVVATNTGDELTLVVGPTMSGLYAKALKDMALSAKQGVSECEDIKDKAWHLKRLEDVAQLQTQLARGPVDASASLTGSRELLAEAAILGLSDATRSLDELVEQIGAPPYVVDQNDRQRLRELKTLCLAAVDGLLAFLSAEGHEAA